MISCDDLTPRIPYLHFWLAAAEAGFAQPGDWQRWADIFIIQMENPALWLIELSMSDNRDAFMKATVDQRLDELAENPLIYANYSDAVVGYSYILWNKKSDTVSQFLLDCGAFVDGMDGSMGPEEPYSILNEFEQTGNFDQAEREIQKLFEPCQQEAILQWGILQSAWRDYFTTKLDVNREKYSDLLFDIRTLDKEGKNGSSFCPSQIGQIRLRPSFIENFEMEMRFWNSEQYQKQWREAVTMLVKGSRDKTCLFTSIFNPEYSNFFNCWILYRFKENVLIHNNLLFLDQLEKPFDLQNPYDALPEYQRITEDGEAISEWSVTVKDLEAWLTRETT